MEINDPSEKNNNVNDPVRAETLRHTDELLLSEAAEKIIDKLSSKSEEAGKQAKKAAKEGEKDESIGKKILDKIVGELGVKVQVVQSTLNRKVQATFKATGKDFSGKAIPLTVTSSPITFEMENELYPVYIDFPVDCPPLKEITLQATGVTYTFEEHGYPELVVTGFGKELPTGPLLEGTGLVTESSQTMNDWIHTAGTMKIAVAERPVIYPIRGNIRVGNPPGGLQGAQVRVFTKTPSTDHETVFNTAYSNPAGDFVADICLFASGNAQPTPPPYIIEVSKPGFETITSAANPNAFIKIKDNPLTYQINMPLATTQILSVSGRVLDNANQGVSAAEVLLSCAGIEYQTTTDATGAYQFPNVLWGNKIELYANKSGFYFNPESRNIASKTKTVAVDLKSATGQRWGDAKFIFSAGAGSLPASVEILRSSSGRIFL